MEVWVTTIPICMINSTTVTAATRLIRMQSVTLIIIIMTTWPMSVSMDFKANLWINRIIITINLMSTRIVTLVELLNTSPSYHKRAQHLALLNMFLVVLLMMLLAPIKHLSKRKLWPILKKFLFTFSQPDLTSHLRIGRLGNCGNIGVFADNRLYNAVNTGGKCSQKDDVKKSFYH